MDYQSIHLDPGENVLLEVRKHWIVFAGNALVLFFGALLPLAVYTILQIFVPNILKMIVLPGNGAALVSFLYILWVLFLWIIFFIEWTVYYFDVKKEDQESQNLLEQK
jgi:ABC-type multidrug transport system fused ATPase/permease subunit